MINFKTFGPTAAFVFTGYGLTACNNDSQKLAADPIQQPAPVVSDPEPESIPAPAIPTVIPEQKLKPIELALQVHPMAPAQADQTLQRAYEILKGDKYRGVTLEDLDAGCHQKEEIVGAGDRKVEACEVYEYALDHYKDHRRAADLIARGTVPWVLDDLDPTTKFDADIRKKVDHAIGALKASPALKDLDPASNEYRDKLAFGLFYFVSFPDRPIRGKAAKKRWEELTRELRVLGLHDFQTYLFQEGGLGIHQFKQRAPVSKNIAALDSLEEKEGGSSAKANLLYAVFEMAGLEPFFIQIPYRAGDAHQDFRVEKGPRTQATIYTTDYKGIGIPMGGSHQLFHPHAMLTLRSYAEHLQYDSLRYYLSVILHQVGNSFEEHYGDSVKAQEYLRASIELSPKNTNHYVSLAIMQNGAEKEKTLRAAHRIDPDNWFANINLATHLAENGNKKEAVPYYKKALESHPEYLNHDNLIYIRNVAEQVVKAHKRPPNFLAIAVRNKVDELLKGKK